MKTSVFLRCSAGVSPTLSSSINLPLQGLRVVDMSRILAGPFCTMLLGDLGADVIKIEHVKVGDDTRTWGPPFSQAGEQSAYFLGVNRNKKSVAVDLKQKEGQELVKELMRGADMALENFVPGKAAELGVDYKSVQDINPKLVYASLSGFGSEGPRAQHLAYDVMISALGGLMGITGTKAQGEEDPSQHCKVGVAITDICTGLATQGAMLAGVIHALRTGQGQHIETSLLATQVSALANVASAYLVSGVVTSPMGTAHASIVPYQAFPCSDGRSVIVGALNDGQFQRLSRALGFPDEEVGLHPDYATNANRVKNRLKLLEMFQNVMSSKFTSDELIEKLSTKEVSVPCAPINTVDKVFEDPQVVHTKRVVTCEHPTVGLLKMVANPATFHGTPLKKLNPPPLHGQHTSQVLKELLGFSDKMLEELHAKKVIHCHERSPPPRK